MSGDLISREAAEKAIHVAHARIGYKYGATSMYIHKNLIHKVLLKIPAVEAEPVRHGEWKGKPIAGYGNVRCSVCGMFYSGNSGRWNYCPNCGAKMDGGAEG